MGFIKGFQDKSLKSIICEVTSIQREYVVVLDFQSQQVKGNVSKNCRKVKFVHSEKTTKFCEIFTLLLSAVHTDKSKVKILQNFVAYEL